MSPGQSSDPEGCAGPVFVMVTMCLWFTWLGLFFANERKGVDHARDQARTTCPAAYSWVEIPQPRVVFVCGGVSLSIKYHRDWWPVF